MLLKVGAVLAAIPLTMVGVVAGTGVVVVDVKPHDGPRIIVPLPLVVAESVARLAPTGQAQRALQKIDTVRTYLPVAEEVVAALAEAPDAELVRVDDGDEHVRITKKGDLLQVRVQGPNENVAVNVPIRLVQDALRQAHHGRLDAGDLVATLRRARMTDLVVVDGRDDRVKISVW
jgi:hypothetical protein